MATMMFCRGLTSDCKGLRPGDAVYVDCEQFVWPKKLVDDHKKSYPFLIGTMGMRSGVFRGPRKLLGFIPFGSLVEVL